MKLDLKTVLGLVITVASLVWAFWGEDLGEILHHVRNADLLLLSLAALVGTLGIPVRALRWRWLLPPSVRTSFQARNAATAIGFAANNVLPARVGEFARVFTLGRLTGLPLGMVFGSLVLERVFDGLVIVGLLFAAMSSPTFPPLEVGGTDPRLLARGVAIMAAVLGAGLFLLAWMPERSVRGIERAAALLPGAVRRPLVDALRSFVRGLAVLRDPRLFGMALLWAVGQWVFTALSYLLALRAFGLVEVSFAGAVFVQAVVSLAVAIPAAPGFFGVYEAASKIALEPWGIPSSRVVSYAIGFHIMAWIPVTLLGLYYAWRLNLRLSDVERSEEAVEEAVEHESAERPAGGRAAD